MYKHLFAVFACTLLLFATYRADAVTEVKHYKYNGASGFGWKFKFVDQWGGVNSQCTIPGMGQCDQYDWLAVYVYGIDGGDPCPECNTPEYGHSLVVAELGSAAPNYLPTLVITYE